MIDANDNLQVATVGGNTVTVGTNFNRPADTAVYASGDVVNDSTSAPTILTFANCARVANGSGFITDAVLVDESNPGTPGNFDLMLYDTTSTPNNDNAAFNPTAAVQRTFIGKISFSTTTPSGTNSVVYHVTGVNLGFNCVGGRNLFGLLVARNAYTPASAGRINIRLHVTQD